MAKDRLWWVELPREDMFTRTKIGTRGDYNFCSDSFLYIFFALAFGTAARANLTATNQLLNLTVIPKYMSCLNYVDNKFRAFSHSTYDFKVPEEIIWTLGQKRIKELISTSSLNKMSILYNARYCKENNKTVAIVSMDNLFPDVIPPTIINYYIVSKNIVTKYKYDKTTNKEIKIKEYDTKNKDEWLNLWETLLEKTSYEDEPALTVGAHRFFACVDVSDVEAAKLNNEKWDDILKVSKNEREIVSIIYSTILFLSTKSPYYIIEYRNKKATCENDPDDNTYINALRLLSNKTIENDLEKKDLGNIGKDDNGKNIHAVKYKWNDALIKGYGLPCVLALTHLPNEDEAVSFEECHKKFEEHIILVKEYEYDYGPKPTTGFKPAKKVDYDKFETLNDTEIW